MSTRRAKRICEGCERSEIECEGCPMQSTREALEEYREYYAF